MSEGRPARVVIVGGGITGLSAAYAFARAMASEQAPLCHVTVVEQSERLGGKIRTEAAGGFLMEAGPDCFLTRKPWMVELCRSLGLDEALVDLGEDRSRHASGKGGGGSSRTFMLAGGRLHELPAGSFMGIPGRLGPLMGSSLLSWPGKLRVALEPFIPPRRGDGDESLAAFGRRRLGREASARLVEPLLSGIFGGDAEQLSMEAAFPMLRRMEERYGSLWAGVRASFRRSAAGKVSGSSNGGPRPGAVFQTLRDGLESVVGVLRDEAEAAGVRFLLGHGVATLQVREGGGGAGDSRGLVLQLRDGQSLEADRVLLTVPAWVAASLVADIAPDAAAALSRIPYRSSASVYVAYDRDQVTHPLAGTGYITARDEERPVGACTWVSSKWPHTTKPDGVLIRLHMAPYQGREPADRSDGELVAEARRELSQVMGITAEPRLVRVFRWAAALPQYVPGHREQLEAIRRGLAHLPGLLVAGAAYEGVGLPDCARQGQEAAERILASLTDGGTDAHRVRAGEAAPVGVFP